MYTVCTLTFNKIGNLVVDLLEMFIKISYEIKYST